MLSGLKARAMDGRMSCSRQRRRLSASLGRRPRICEIKKKPRSAESAIQSGMSSVVDQIETRFQRSCLHGNLKSWGDAPGSEMNAAPLALQVSSVKTLGYYHGSSLSLTRSAVYSRHS